MAKQRCTCPNKTKILGVLRCPTHEPEHFTDDTEVVRQARKKPEPPEPAPPWVDRFAQHAAK